MAARNDEGTVVLCVEIENSGEAGQGIGDEVEKVDVSISGDEAKATLITWGSEGFKAEDAVFPLKIAQYTTAHPDLQRAVSISIHGKPYTQGQEFILYPPGTFSSKRNCVLDLAVQQSQIVPHLDPTDPSTGHPIVLPELLYPFLVFGSQNSKPSPTLPMDSGGTKPKLLTGCALKSLTPRFTSTPTSVNTARMSTPPSFIVHSVTYDLHCSSCCLGIRP